MYFISLYTLNLMFLLNNESKNSKKINTYINYLKKYVKKGISKCIVFPCILLNSSVVTE